MKRSRSQFYCLFSVRADAPGVPEAAQKGHVQWQHRSRSSMGKGLCFRLVDVQKVHFLFGIFFFPFLKEGVG